MALAYEELLQNSKGLMHLVEFIDKLETSYRRLKAGYPADVSQIYVFENQQQAKEFFIQNLSCSKDNETNEE